MRTWHQEWTAVREAKDPPSRVRPRTGCGRVVDRRCADAGACLRLARGADRPGCGAAGVLQRVLARCRHAAVKDKSAGITSSQCA